jgi:flagellar protein FliS
MNWKSAYLESRIVSASPLDLVAIAYEHAMLRIEEAREHLAAGDIRERARCISRATVIIGELEKTLDLDAGGEIAANLSRLYRYMRERLTAANVQQSDEPLAEVYRLLETIAGAWQTIAASMNQPAAAIPDTHPAPMPSFFEPAELSFAGWSA